MNYKKQVLILLLLSFPAVFIQRASADFEGALAREVYNSAWKTIDEKFYFKSDVDLNKLREKYSRKITSLDDAYNSIKNLVKSLRDPYTRFLTKEEFKDEEDIINSALVGIGVKLDNKKPVILDVLPNSPAAREDIRPEDYILAVNNQSTRSLNINQITRLLRGENNTKLSVKIKRGNKILAKTLTRAELQFKSVSSQPLNSDIAVIKIDSFIPDNTSELFKDELIKLMSTSGIIIDLRGNSGGLFKNATKIADMFLSEGKIVSTLTKGTRSIQFANSNKLTDANVVVLVNEKTASASEILASALRGNNRAILIGRKTFGKGLVQEIVKLPDGSALHVTVAAYITASGRNINMTGIMPDEIISNDDMQLQKAKEILLTLKDKKEKLEIASL